MTTADVVICGSGVAGLAAACALGALGLEVELLEKKRVEPPIPKGEVLQPGSLDVLDRWGVLGGLAVRGAVRLDRLVAREADGTEVLAMDFGLLGAERPWMLAHYYTAILECLGESLGPTVRWRRGALVTDLVRDITGRAVGVRATVGGVEEEIRAALVVAADGMSSRIRKLAGLTARPLAYGHRLLALDPRGPALAAEVSAHITDRGLVMLYPLPEDRVRLYVQMGPDELRGVDNAGLRHWSTRLVEDVPALAPLAPGLDDALDRRHLLKVWRYRAPSVVRPGVVLVGEAAHGVHPLAAQGMNTAIGDADVLARHLAIANLSDTGSVDRALRSYADERSVRVRDIDVMSHNAARMMTSTSRVGRALGRRLLGGTAKSPRLSYLLTHNLSGVGMRPLGPIDRLVQLGLLPDRMAYAPRPAPPRRERRTGR